MTAPQAAGQRYLALAGEPISFHHIALALRARLGEVAAKAPTRTAPAWLLRLPATGNPTLRETVPQLGVVRRASNAKARKELDWSPRSNEDAVVATAESLVRLGLLSGQRREHGARDGRHPGRVPAGPARADQPATGRAARR
ncbi:hypothetical protein [Streptomyces sp. NPDC006309]|uniref:hypothetical protein n=1 Tax=Streptomyces sp. NPDC006309 TaxID=3156749 RepID=UPI0033B0BF23